MKRYVMMVLCCLTLSACAPKHAFVIQDQTILDQATGVVWAKNANLPGKQLLWKSDGNVYAFIQQMNKDNFAGYADWRVPSKEEFEQIIAYAKSQGYDALRYETWPYQKLRQGGFIDVRDYGYWTSTRKTNEELYIADLASGEILPKPDSKPFYLWPVRGGRGR